MRNARRSWLRSPSWTNSNAPIFSAADVILLREVWGCAADRVFAVASRLSGIGDSDMDRIDKTPAARAAIPVPTRLWPWG